MKIGNIKNVIFDLGGVIINLSEARTLQGFADISSFSVEELKDIILNSPLYKQFEKGLITGAAFRDGVREQLYIKSSDDAIDTAMNAMLLDIPVERIELLKKLNNRFRLFLLSNTNEIHLACFAGIIHNTTGDSSIDVFFEKAYYSHLVKMRKPDVGIYKHVLGENNLRPEETLFLDDNASNLEGAKSLGIQTYHITNPSLLFNLFE